MRVLELYGFIYGVKNGVKLAGNKKGLQLKAVTL